MWWYQRLCNAILTSIYLTHVLETCRGMKQTYCKAKILCIKLVNYWYKYTEMHGQQNVKKINATCFEQAYCSSSGGTFLYIQQLVYVMRYVGWLLANISQCTAHRILKTLNWFNTLSTKLRQKLHVSKNLRAPWKWPKYGAKRFGEIINKHNHCVTSWSSILCTWYSHMEDVQR